MSQHRASVAAVSGARGRLRLAACAAAGLGLALVAALWVLHGRATVADERVTSIAAPVPLASERAERIARRASAAHADVTAVWRHDFRWRLGRGYTAPEIVHFSGGRPSPCAGAATPGGPFYCAIDRTVSLDLAFLDRLAAQMRSEGKRAVALVVARIAAEHVQVELAIAGDAARRRAELGAAERRALDHALILQADCLAGVWANRAGDRLGVVEAGAWGRVVAGARTIAPDAAASARLDAGSVPEREQAFAHGYENGQIRDCLTAELSGVLG